MLLEHLFDVVHPLLGRQSTSTTDLREDLRTGVVDLILANKGDDLLMDEAGVGADLSKTQEENENVMIVPKLVVSTR